MKHACALGLIVGLFCLLVGPVSLAHGKSTTREKKRVSLLEVLLEGLVADNQEQKRGGALDKALEEELGTPEQKRGGSLDEDLDENIAGHPAQKRGGSLDEDLDEDIDDSKRDDLLDLARLLYELTEKETETVEKKAATVDKKATKPKKGKKFIKDEKEEASKVQGDREKKKKNLKAQGAYGTRAYMDALFNDVKRVKAETISEAATLNEDRKEEINDRDTDRESRFKLPGSIGTTLNNAADKAKAKVESLIDQGKAKIQSLTGSSSGSDSDSGSDNSKKSLKALLRELYEELKDE